MNKVTVSKLDHAIFAGDWHDAPLRWQAVGPEDRERQCFATRAHARQYAAFRRVMSEQEAHRAYVEAA